MTLNSYLTALASDAVLSANELSSIDRSIGALSQRLNGFFRNDVREQFRFGSSTRGTILPRKYDPRSDIDYMIVFEDLGHQPQTYLNQLRRFALQYYPSSSIKQSAPTIVLELNHIRFDLVPATRSFWGGYRIPDGQGDWIGTNPNDFNRVLTEENVACRSMLKPAIRLAKLWNARTGYPFESYVFEKWLVTRNYWLCSDVQSYFFRAMSALEPVESVQWKNDAITRAKRILAVALKRAENYETKSAVLAIERLFFRR